VVLVAPLDWGLGHATRCIPLIHQFLKADCEVIIAAEGQQRQLLAQEFPCLLMLDLAGYRLKYGKNKGQTLMKIILQVPKILIEINREYKWLKKIAIEKHLDIVIADNRIASIPIGGRFPIHASDEFLAGIEASFNIRAVKGEDGNVYLFSADERTQSTASTAG